MKNSFYGKKKNPHQPQRFIFNFLDKTNLFNPQTSYQDCDEERQGFMSNDYSDDPQTPNNDGWKNGTINQIEQETTRDKLGRIDD